MILAGFFSKAIAYLGSGFEERQKNEEPENFSSLPLAYQIEEMDSDYSEDSDNLAELDNPPDFLENLNRGIRVCTACSLGMTRITAVPGEGSEVPLVMVVGDVPGADEDSSGRPFMGKAGQLLDRMLASIGLSREKNCYISYIIKCRLPNPLDPDNPIQNSLEKEMRICSSFLERQIRYLKPRLVLNVGGFGGFIYNDSRIPILTTYHPNALLEDESLKRRAFEDMKSLMAALAALDRSYAEEVKELIKKYAASDKDFANRVQGYTF